MNQWINGSIVLAIPTRFSQIVVNHPAPILLRFGHGRVAAFFIPADLVFGVEAFEHEFAGGDRLRTIAAMHPFEPKAASEAKRAGRH